MILFRSCIDPNLLPWSQVQLRESPATAASGDTDHVWQSLIGDGLVQSLCAPPGVWNPNTLGSMFVVRLRSDLGIHNGDDLDKQYGIE